MDPSKPLQDAQHERFACELAKGCSQDEAYELAGYARHRSSASRLRTNANVSQRVEWLKQQAAKGDILEMIEKRQICAQIARGGEKDSDRLKAIQVDNDLAGEGSEAKGAGALALLLGRLRK